MSRYPRELDETCPICGDVVVFQKTMYPPINVCGAGHQWQVAVMCGGPPWHTKKRLDGTSEWSFIEFQPADED